ncbi:PE-PGRS family protein [Nocardia sp. ET3-3]|uniref:PE-PGRS family protein n=1 Tax=Nocardia terrae TaxID=2675851 RepID=A0A7K1V6Y7_9NOCA|nr:PE-PGRS family protein [Nocardia terrae]MVU82297.1 PE-PGRS family protein [Nocardia terrae]
MTPEPLELSEYETISVPFDDLTEHDLQRLRALEAQRRVTVSADRHGWRLTAGATVGVLALDRRRLIMTPKIAFPRNALLTWLSYAIHAPVPHEATRRRWSIDRHGIADPVAAALADECRILLRDGLRRDYVPHDRVAPVLRGRLDIMAQATKRFGMVDQLHARTHERAVQVWENEVCGLALRVAQTRVGDAGLARELAALAAEFPTGSRSSVARHLDRAHYTRLNARYRPALTWAGLLLRGGGVTDLLIDRGLDAESLLLDMPRLWEAAACRLIGDAAPAGAELVASSGKTALTVFGDRESRPPLRPDALVRLSADRVRPALLPIDAKYKRYDSKTVSAADVHQLLTYIAGYSPGDSPVAAIVHPSPGVHSHRTLRISGNERNLGTIHVLGIDTGAQPTEAMTHVRDALWPSVK